MSAFVPTQTLASLAEQTGGRLAGADRPFISVSTDSRTLLPGALFVALKGPNFDGHAFVATAAEGGAAGALVERELPIDLPQVVVNDSLAALSIFARAWRRQYHIPVVAVTGSNGKTTTKEMIGSILRRQGASLVTRGNLNNHIGVPLTLLELESGHRTAVIEMGANHQGEIAALAAIAEPTIGIVTNAGEAHLEGFGGLDGVAQGKGELYRELGPGDVAIINADDRYAGFWRSRSNAERTLTFGLDSPADFTARDVEAGGGTGGFHIRFTLVTPVGERGVTLRLAGTHNLRNALGAAAAAYAAGASLDDMAAGLDDMRAVGGRLDLKPALNGAFLIDDSYNANPSSLRAGLDALKAVGGRRWLILGDMMELGEGAEALHADVGRYAKSSGIERMLAVGARARLAAEAFGEGAEWFASLDALVTTARTALEPGISVLIKGSRSNRLERAAAALAAQPGRTVDGH